MKTIDSTAHHTLLLRHLATALLSGRALRSVPDALAQNPEFSSAQRQAYVRLANELGRGTPLGQALSAMSRHTRSQATMEWLDSGANPADRAEILHAIAADLLLQQRGRHRLRLALVWPTFLAVAAVVMFTVVALFVAPALREAFENFGLPLPKITQTVFSGRATDWLFLGWEPALLVGLLVLALVLTYARSEVSRPLVRIAYALRVMRRSEQAAFVARILGFVGAVPAHTAAPAVAHLAASGLVGPLRAKAISLRQALEAGHSWSRALHMSAALPVHYTLHWELAEQTAHSQQVLATLSQQAQEEWDDALARFERNMVGLIYFTLASLISVVAAAVYLPIFKLGQVV